MIDLYRNAKPYEFGYFSIVREPLPTCTTWGWTDWLYRRVEWRFDGEWFHTHILLWLFRWYRGTAKIDGTRTYMLWSGQLGVPVPPMPCYVKATTPKEKFSVRFRWRQSNREMWDSMGSI